MIDFDLTRRLLTKINKEVVNAFAMADNNDQRHELQRAINDITFMYDVLHISDIDMINISNPTK